MRMNGNDFDSNVPRRHSNRISISFSSSVSTYCNLRIDVMKRKLERRRKQIRLCRRGVFAWIVQQILPLCTHILLESVSKIVTNILLKHNFNFKVVSSPHFVWAILSAMLVNATYYSPSLRHELKWIVARRQGMNSMDSPVSDGWSCSFANAFRANFWCHSALHFSILKCEKVWLGMRKRERTTNRHHGASNKI